jgi:hypothetical protein
VTFLVNLIFIYLCSFSFLFLASLGFSLLLAASLFLRQGLVVLSSHLLIIGIDFNLV